VLKLTGITRGQPGLSPDELAARWRDAPAPATGRPAELCGLVISQVLRKLTGDLDADAIVELWWDDGAAPGDPAAADWDAVARHAPSSSDLLWGGVEDVYKARAYPAGDARLIGTAKRRADFTTDAFFDYWRDVHAPLGGQAPALGGYVVTRLGPRLAGDLEIDAIVSLWWPDEELLLAGLGSEETATAWQDVPNYAQTDGTFWVCREHVAIAPPATGPGTLDR
jgi:uncharacterized protein (TIGR02118 family)